MIQQLSYWDFAETKADNPKFSYWLGYSGYASSIKYSANKLILPITSILCTFFSRFLVLLGLAKFMFFCGFSVYRYLCLLFSIYKG